IKKHEGNFNGLDMKLKEKKVKNKNLQHKGVPEDAAKNTHPSQGVTLLLFRRLMHTYVEHTRLLEQLFTAHSSIQKETLLYAACLTVLDINQIREVLPHRTLIERYYSVSNPKETKKEEKVKHETMAAHLMGIHSAIKMLNSRVRVLHHYLNAMQKGQVRYVPLCIYVIGKSPRQELPGDDKGSNPPTSIMYWFFKQPMEDQRPCGSSDIDSGNQLETSSTTTSHDTKSGSSTD
ncbi:hypothetical protein Tco_0868414, partial [Tanacetum coccineum]